MPNSALASDTYHARHIGNGSAPVEWATIHRLTDFSFPWLSQQTPETEFRAFWNSNEFRFRFSAVDSDIVLADGPTAKERVIGSDRVELFFSCDRKLSRYFALEMDPRGDVLDYEARYHRQMNWDWSCPGLKTTATRTSDGYAVEATIPIATLRELDCLHRDDEGDYLIAGMYRAEFSREPDNNSIVENWISWQTPDVSDPDFHVPSSFGTIRLTSPKAAKHDTTR